MPGKSSGPGQGRRPPGQRPPVPAGWRSGHGRAGGECRRAWDNKASGHRPGSAIPRSGAGPAAFGLVPGWAVISLTSQEGYSVARRAVSPRLRSQPLRGTAAARGVALIGLEPDGLSGHVTVQCHIARPCPKRQPDGTGRRWPGGLRPCSGLGREFDQEARGPGRARGVARHRLVKGALSRLPASALPIARGARKSASPMGRACAGPAACGFVPGLAPGLIPGLVPDQP